MFGAAHVVDFNSVMAASVDTAVQARQGGENIASLVARGGAGSQPAGSTTGETPGSSAAVSGTNNPVIVTGTTGVEGVTA